MKSQRPLNYITVIPLTFAVGAVAALLCAALLALGIPREAVVSIAPPIGVFAMMGFVIWARTGKDGQFQFWSK